MQFHGSHFHFTCCVCTEVEANAKPQPTPLGHRQHWDHHPQQHHKRRGKRRHGQHRMHRHGDCLAPKMFKRIQADGLPCHANCRARWNEQQPPPMRHRWQRLKKWNVGGLQYHSTAPFFTYGHRAIQHIKQRDHVHHACKATEKRADLIGWSGSFETAHHYGAALHGEWKQLPHSSRF